MVAGIGKENLLKHMTTTNNFFKQKKVLVVHHWAYKIQRKPLFSDNLLYFSVHGENETCVVNFQIGSKIDMGLVVSELKKQNWEPDLFIAKVDAFQNIVPVNVAALKCPKVLILGDTQHGNNPLVTMVNYATSEKYDFYISDHKRHHLWFYHLSGITNSYWLPGLFLKPPITRFSSLSISNSIRMGFQGKPVFIGQYGEHHPRRKRLIENLKEYVPDLYASTVDQQDSLMIFNKASVSLNISLNGDLNLRYLEIMSAGGLQIADRLSFESGAELLFEEGEEIVFFDNQADLIDKVNYYQKHKRENLRIRDKGEKRFYNEYCPEKMLGYLNDILEGKAIDSRFVTNSIDRISKIDWTVITLERLLIYQLVQDIHRQQEEVTVLIDAKNPHAFPEDYIDLPRVRVLVYDHEHITKNRLRRYMESSVDSKRLTFVNEIERAGKADIIISKYRDFFSSSNSKDENSIIIYDKPLAAGHEIKVGVCKKSDMELGN